MVNVAASESANAPMETDDEEERALQAALALSMGQGPDATVWTPHQQAPK